MYNFLTVCVGSGYSADYITAIHNMVKRNFKAPFEFYCITDKYSFELPRGVKKIKPPMQLEGWWNKLYMFSDIVPEGRLIYLDLDLIIRADITDMITGYNGVYCGDEDHIHWGTPTFNNVQHKDLDSKIDCSLGTAFVSMQAHALTDVFKLYIDNREKIEEIFKLYGDQLFTSYALKGKFDLWERLYPETHGICSYKFDILGRFPRLPQERQHLIKGQRPYTDFKIINFHGKPKPHELLDIDWIRGNWIV